jgi:subtilase family serine protease
MLLRENVIMRTNQNICFIESIEAEKFKLTNKKRYSVRVQTDFKRQILEWNENNNRKTETIFVGSDSEDRSARTISTDNDIQEFSTNVDFYINDINFLRAERKIEVAVCTKNKDYAGYNHILYEANNKVYTQYVFLDLKKNECDAFKLGYRTLNLELEQNYTINVTIDPEE